jgi:hypothetical protein
MAWPSRQLFQADLSGGEAHAVVRNYQRQLGRNQRNFIQIDERTREQAHRQIGVTERAIEIASAWLLARCLTMAG